MTTEAQPVDEAKLEQFMGQAVTDMGAAMNGVLVMIGASSASGTRCRARGR